MRLRWKLKVIKLLEKSLEQKVVSFNNELSLCRVKRASLQQSRGEISFNLNVLKVDIGEFLQALSDRATEGPLLKSRRSQTQAAEYYRQITGMFKYEPPKTYLG